MIVLACGGDLDQLREEIGDLKRAGIEVLNDIRELKSNNKKLGEISISLALREPVLFEKIFKIDGNILLYNVDFKQNAQCKLSFDSFEKIKLETSFKNNDFDIKNTDWVKIDENAVENLEAFVKSGGKLTGFDKDKMKFTWNVDLNKSPDEWLLFGGNKVENSFINICKILKCFNLKDEKFGLETCLKDNKFFGLDVAQVENLLQSEEKEIVRDMVLTLFYGLEALDSSIGIRYVSSNSIEFYANKGLGNDKDVKINLNPKQ
jgi:hypothetical protein